MADEQIEVKHEPALNAERASGTLEKLGYRKTKLGWVPKDWRVIKLKKVAEIQTGLAKGKKNIKDPIYMPYLRVANVQDGFLDLTEVKKIKVSRDKVSRYSLKEGDVLLTEGGDFDKLGRGTIWKNEISNCLHQNHIFVVRTDRERLLPYFLSALTSSEYGRHYFVLSSKQSTNLASINSTQLKSFPVILPPLPEQRKIAAILSTWDRAIERTQALITAKKEQQKGLMQRLLSPRNSWKEFHYGQLLKEVRRPIEFNDDELYHLISVRRRSGGLFHRESLYGHQIKTKDLREAREGDFLISKMQIVHGASALTTKDFDGMKISGSYIAVVSRDPNLLEIKFLNWLSKLPWFYHQTFVSSYGVHIEKMTFDYKTFLKQKVRIPDLTDQKNCVRILDLTDKEINVMQRKVELLKEQKKGLMQQLLTGKVRVK